MADIKRFELEFERFLQDKNCRDQTIQKYLYYYERFGKLENFKQEYVDKFVRDCGNGSPVRAFINNLKTFLIRNRNSLIELSLDIDELRDINLIRQTGTKIRKSIQYFTGEEIKQLEQAMTDERNKLMLWISFYCGLRVNELIHLDVEDFNWFKWKKNPGSIGILRIRGEIAKRGKERIVYVPSYLMKRLYNWLAQHKIRHDRKTGQRRSMFIIHMRRWQQLLETAGKKALRKSIHPHMLRHSCATWLLSKNWSLQEIAKYLGHESIATTQIYAHLENSKIKEKYENLFDVS